MFKTLQNLEEPFRVLVYLSSLAEEGNAFELFRFVPKKYEASLVESVQEVLACPKKERKKRIAQELKKLIQNRKIQPMGEVHPGWFLEALKDETPRTVGLILKNLPSDKVRYLIENLPVGLRNKLPKLGQFQTVSKELESVIRSQFESLFVTPVVPQKTEQLSVSDLYFLKSEEILAFFKRIGLAQLSIAFRGVHKGAFKALLTRLPLVDAKALQTQGKNSAKPSPQEARQAQVLLLDLPIENMEPENLCLEVGMAFFARSILKEELKWIRALQFKLPPREGYLLKRYIDESITSRKGKRVEWFQAQVLEYFKAEPTA